MVKTAVFGVSGYTGLELVRILHRHPQASIVWFGSRRPENPAVADLHPSLAGMVDGRCRPLDVDAVAEVADVAFLALPHTLSMRYVPSLLDAGLKVIDLSADYRFSDAALYEKVYGTQHTDPKGLSEAVFGLPELCRDEVSQARLIANPGCYVTGALMGLLPLVAGGHVDADSIIVDAKSGVSGAGRTPAETTHFPECNESVCAYKVGTHRHAPEIEEVLSRVAGAKVGIIFTPHLVPMNRGILSTVYARSRTQTSAEQVLSVFESFYKDAPFVRMKKLGRFPATRDVERTNFCDIGVSVQTGTVVVVTAIDNLVKGASGQAVQNMNLMCRMDEKTGLI